jgi:hypothetical protein
MMACLLSFATARRPERSLLLLASLGEAHCTDFKRQQAQRVWAIVRDHLVPSSGGIGHRPGSAAARYLSAPEPVIGMACYNLARAQVRAGQLDEASATLSYAVALNPDLAGIAARDPDLAAVSA